MRASTSAEDAPCRCGLSGIRRDGAVGAIATFLALFVINLALKGGHFSAFDLKTLCMNVLPLALVALGQFFVVMTNGIDLSLGPVMSVAGSIAALTFSASVAGAIVLALGAAALAGACNGLLVVRLRLPPILATLATMSIFQGVALVILPSPGGNVPPGLTDALTNGLDRAPTPLLLLIAATVVTSWIMSTPLGLWLRAIGGDEGGTRSSGVPVQTVKFSAYVIAALLAGLGGVLSCGRDRKRIPHDRRQLYSAVDRSGRARRRLHHRRSRIDDRRGVRSADADDHRPPALLRQSVVLLSELDQRGDPDRGGRDWRPSGKDWRSCGGRNAMQDRQVARSAMRALARPAALAPLTILGGIAVLLIAGGMLAPGFLALSNILLLFVAFRLSRHRRHWRDGGDPHRRHRSLHRLDHHGRQHRLHGRDARRRHAIFGRASRRRSPSESGAGFVNGVGVAKLKISPIVMTLGMNNVMQGLTLIYSQGTPSGSAPDSIKWIATGWVGPAPVVVLVWIGLGVIVSIGLHATRGGRYLYGVGESPFVSRLSGIDNDRVIIAAYAISGLCAAVTGVLFTGFSTMAFLGMGDQFVLPAIAAVVLGGASIYGGRGTYAGSFVGAFFLTVLTTVLTIVNIAIGYRNIIYGLVIIAAVLLYRAYARERE